MVSRPEQDPAASLGEPAASTRVDFPCGQCGALLVWEPDHDALFCAHCGGTQAVPRADGEIVERPLSEAGAARVGLGALERAVRCGNCGATVEFAGVNTAQSCAFCGSSNVLAQDANRRLIRPESIVPLDVGRAAVEQHFQRWIRGLWFRPNALKQTRRFEALGVYVPYWTFDALVRSDWSADAGYYYYVTVMVPVTRNGRTSMQPQQVRKIRWVPAWGRRDDAFDDLLVHASRGVSVELARKLGGFDTARLVPYRPEYLAGCVAEEYELDLEGAWDQARAQIVETQRRRCAGDVPGDTHRDLRVHNDIDGVRWKHVLLPMWSLNYSYGGKTWPVLVHGLTGAVHGKAPISWIKVLLFVAAIAAVLTAAFAIGAARG